jgi:hypothetical protein
MDDGTPITPAAHHWLWLRLVCNQDIKKLLLIAPPETAKTTWLVSAWLGCCIGFWPEANVIIGATSGSTATKRSLSLRAMVASKAWQETFPGVLPVSAALGMEWSPAEWSIAPKGVPFPGRIHPTVFAFGPDSSSAGGSRADIVLGDDLLDKINTYTQGQRDKMDSWIHSTLLSRRKARVGRAVCIGTSWHWDDSYMRMLKMGGWIVCHIKALYDGPEVYADLYYPDSWEGARLGDEVAGAEL